MKIPYLLPLLGLAIASHATAATVLLWDGSTTSGYVTGNLSYATSDSGTLTTHTSSVAYSTTTPFNISSYSGPSLFGGVYAVAVDDVAAGSVSHGVIRNDTPEIIRSQSPMTDADVSYTNRSAILLSSAPIGSNLSFADISEIDTQARVGLGVASAVEFRWLAVADNVTYVSSDFANLSISFAHYQLTDPASTNWATWAPGADLSLGSLTYDVAGSTISNISHVGYYIAIDKTGSNSQTTVDVTTYGVTTVPEPSTYAMIAGLLVLGMGLIRRRQK